MARSAPDWPRMMRRDFAAAYCDLSAAGFLREVLNGTTRENHYHDSAENMGIDYGGVRTHTRVSRRIWLFREENCPTQKCGGLRQGKTSEPPPWQGRRLYHPGRGRTEMAVNPITPELRVCERPIVSHPVLPYFQDAERGPERIARFWAKVAKVGPNDCWEWTASRGRSHGGYGQFKVHMGPVRTNLHANRIAYALATGHDPIGLVVRHTCDNPSCCNPAHLLSGTTLDNARDKMERGRWRTGNQAGTANPRAKLTDLDIRIIVEKLQAGHSNQRIAAMLPVGHALVSRIRYGLSWATEARAHGWTPSPRPRSTTQEQAS